MVGTPKNSVAGSSAAAATTAAGSKPGSSTAEPPAGHRAVGPHDQAVGVEDGRQWTSRSSGDIRQARVTDSTPASRFRWRSTAPLGAPVVPDVKQIRAGSAGTARVERPGVAVGQVQGRARTPRSARDGGAHPLGLLGPVDHGAPRPGRR